LFEAALTVGSVNAKRPKGADSPDDTNPLIGGERRKCASPSRVRKPRLLAHPME
jgi:hypothetical protein